MHVFGDRHLFLNKFGFVIEVREVLLIGSWYSLAVRLFADKHLSGWF